MTYDQSSKLTRVPRLGGNDRSFNVLLDPERMYSRAFFVTYQVGLTDKEIREKVAANIVERPVTPSNTKFTTPGDL